jgi:hypothetical protein
MPSRGGSSRCAKARREGPGGTAGSENEDGVLSWQTRTTLAPQQKFLRGDTLPLSRLATVFTLLTSEEARAYGVHKQDLRPSGLQRPPISHTRLALCVKPWAHVNQMIQIQVGDTEGKDEAKPLSAALAYEVEGRNGRPDTTDS